MQFSKTNPAQLLLKERFPLTAPGSSKQIIHLSLSTKNISLPFTPGDSLAILPTNDPEMVSRWIEALGKSAATPVYDRKKEHTYSLEQFLLHKVNLYRLSSSWMQILLHTSSSSYDTAWIEDYCKNHTPLESLSAFPPTKIDLQALLDTMPPLLPRFYSIASSPLFCPEEIHLTLALNSFIQGGVVHYGVATHFLNQLAIPGKSLISCYVQHSPHFRLPSNPDLPIIMIGPGTGIAPFRSFLQERFLLQHKGKNLLFFGARNISTDFLYKEWLLSLVEKGFLEIETAFSRDQETKIYVQDRIKEKSAYLWDLILQGAFIYICGTADPMAKQVEETLLYVVEKEGGKSREEAYAFLRKMRHEHRLLLDVY